MSPNLDRILTTGELQTATGQMEAARNMEVITSCSPQWQNPYVLHAWTCGRWEAPGALVLRCGNVKQLSHIGRQIGCFLENKTCCYQAHYNTLPNIYPMELKSP